MIPFRRARSRSNNGKVGSLRKAVAAPAAMIALALVSVPLSSRPAQAFETARDLVTQCKSVDASALRSERDAYIPGTAAALQCWGYMQAMQDLLVLVDDDGNDNADDNRRCARECGRVVFPLLDNGLR